MKQNMTWLALAGLITTGLSLQAQDDEVIELSPFAVDAAEDVGYRATTTLAGSRVRSNISDLGASISVITSEFLEDTGATDGESLLSYVGSMEVGGTQGNFSTIDDLANLSTNGARNNPQNAQRVRGLVSATTTRDYFNTLIPFDSYNTTRVTVNRGPNSILFGLGSPGGVINQGTERAAIGANNGKVSFRLDHRGGYRASFNVNRTLIEDRLAVRLAAMHEDVQFKQDPATEEDTRFYFAWDATLFKNEDSNFLGKTSLRGSYENGEIFRNPPDVVPPIDGYSSWWDGIGDQETLNNILAVPGVDFSDIPNGAVTEAQVRAAVNAGLATVPEGTDLDTWAANEGQFIPKVGIDRFNNAGRDNVTSFIPFFLYNAINYNSPDAGTQPGWNDPDLAGIQGLMGRWRLGNNGIGGTKDIRWTSAATGGAGFFAPSLRNREIFDYHNLLFQGTTNEVNTDFDLYQAVLEQQLLNGNMGFEIAFDRQERVQERFNAFSGGNSKQISIDAQIWQSPGDVDFDGTGDFLLNENFGRPVVRWADNVTTTEWNEQETIRATVFGTLDFKEVINNDRWGGILGNHTVTGLYEDRTNDFRNRGVKGSWWADQGKFPGAGEIATPRAFGSDDFRRTVRSQVYLGDSGAGLSSSDQLRIDGPILVDFPKVGDSYGIWYYDTVERSGIQNTWRIIENVNNANLSQSNLASEAFNLQSTFLGGNLVANWARRKDTQEAFQRLQEGPTFGVPFSTDENGDPVRPLRVDLPGINEVDGNWNEAELLFLEDEPASVDEDHTTTWSVVGKYPENWLGELPWGMDLSGHYYEAESFQPAGISNNLIGQPLSSPFGETTEKGLSVSFLEGRFSIRYNEYKTVNAAARTSLGGELNQVIGRVRFALDRIILAENDATVSFFPTDPDELTWTRTSTPSNRDRLTGTDADLLGLAENDWDGYYDILTQMLPTSFNHNGETFNVRDIYNFNVIRPNGIALLEENDIRGLNATRDFVAEGKEIDIVGQVTDNLTLSMNIAQQKTVTSNTGPVAFPLALEIMQNIQDLGLYDIRDSPVQGESGAIGATRYEAVLRGLRIEKAKDNTVSQEQREWRVNAVARYDFRDGRFKGLSVGGALRYQDEIAIGYPNAFDEFGNSVPDIANPILGPDELNGDMFLRYGKKIMNGKADWTIQLNARNLYRQNGNDDIPVAANPDGTVSIIRIPNERQWFLTNSFSF